MARMTLSYKNLYDQVSNFLGLTATGTSPTGTDLATCKSIVDRGIRSFLYPLDENGQPYEWRFLRQFWTLTTVKNKWKYALPIDFSELSGTFYYDGSDGNPPLEKIDAQQIIDMRGDVSVETGYPTHFAITSSIYDVNVGTIYELWLYPNPDQAYTLNTFYRIDPIQMSATTDLTVGGIRACEAILESCLGKAEIQEEEVAGVHSQEAERLILKLIKFDRTTHTNKIGNLYSDKDRDWPTDRQLKTYPDISNNVYQ